MQDVHPADRVLAAVGPYLQPGIDRQIVYREILTALEPASAEDIGTTALISTEDAVQVADQFDVAGPQATNQPVANQPATARLRAQVRMGHRE